ncbi:EscE/YscE/SsaE family type III secretion system needle protein co-chaperone [Aeromonas veronii]
MDTLTNLEEQLAQDPLGHLRYKLISQLDTYEHQLIQALRQPKTQLEYASLERKRQSCLAARSVIDKLWKYAQHSKEFR